METFCRSSSCANQVPLFKDLILEFDVFVFVFLFMFFGAQMKNPHCKEEQRKNCTPPPNPRKAEGAKETSKRPTITRFGPPNS
jgi:hypothetical protein